MPLPSLDTAERLREDEAQLIRQAQQGDRAAFAALVEDHYDRLYRWLYHLSHDRHTAEDLVTLMFPSSLAGYVPGLDLVAEGNAWIASHPQASAALTRILRERIAVVERMLSAQACDAAGEESTRTEEEAEIGAEAAAED